MKYQVRYFCKRCNHELSWNTKMNSLGCCPHCGHVSGSTICDTVAMSFPVKPRKVTEVPLYLWSCVLSAALIGVCVTVARAAKSSPAVAGAVAFAILFFSLSTTLFLFLKKLLKK